MASTGSSVAQESRWSLKPTPLNTSQPVPSDIDIARSVKGKSIVNLCEEIGLVDYEQVGNYKAKVKTFGPKHVDEESRGSYVVITGVNPTSSGEGKSTVTIGLAQALSTHLSRNTIACLRQPSQGPTFGMKGGAAGGGYSQVWPMEDFNLHLTGDIHAISAANNLLVAALDTRIFHEATQNDDELYKRLVRVANRGSDSDFTFTKLQKKRLAKLGIPDHLHPLQLDRDQMRRFARLDVDPKTITINRVVDINDRFLRQITVGESPTEKNMSRKAKFTISVASELMAILALAQDFQDFCDRVGRMVVAFTNVSDLNEKPQPVTCDDLCVTGAVCALLRDAIYPTLIQTLEGSPVLVHCGPFANIAHGNSSIIADKIALDLVGRSGFVITEAGFGSDIGFEKFMGIKCRNSNLLPDCAIIVVTVKAVKAHGLALAPKGSTNEEVLHAGSCNMRAHIVNVSQNFSVPVIVAINHFHGDTQLELDLVTKEAMEAGANRCEVVRNWALGGAGAIELATSVINVCNESRISNVKPQFLYDVESTSIMDKIKTIATRVYGASDVDFSESVEKKIALLEEHGYGRLPVCIAKTPTSLSHDAKMLGVPTDFVFPIVDIDVSAGAGFVYALAGSIMTMPGLPTRPAYFDITVDPVTGQIDGLY